jgi:hypothetical protein
LFHALPSLAPYHFPGLLKLGGGQSVSIAAGAARRCASPLVGLTRSCTVSRQTLCSHSPDVRRSAWYRCRTSTDCTAVFFFWRQNPAEDQDIAHVAYLKTAVANFKTHVASRSGHSPPFDPHEQYYCCSSVLKTAVPPFSGAPGPSRLRTKMYSSGIFRYVAVDCTHAANYLLLGCHPLGSFPIPSPYPSITHSLPNSKTLLKTSTA